MAVRPVSRVQVHYRQEVYLGNDINNLQCGWWVDQVGQSLQRLPLSWLHHYAEWLDSEGSQIWSWRFEPICRYACRKIGEPASPDGEWAVWLDESWVVRPSKWFILSSCCSWIVYHLLIVYHSFTADLKNIILLAMPSLPARAIILSNTIHCDQTELPSMNKTYSRYNESLTNLSAAKNREKVLTRRMDK